MSSWIQPKVNELMDAKRRSLAHTATAMKRVWLIALAAALLHAPAASAQFGAPEVNDPELRVGDAMMPGAQLAADGAGNALWASFARDGLGNRRMAIYERCAGTAAWPRTTLLGTPAVDLQPQGIAVSPAGHALAVWRVTNGPDSHTFLSSARPAGGAWGPPQTIVTGDISSVEFALSDAGDAVAAWNSGEPSVEASVRPAGGAWSAPHELTGANQSARVAMSAGGDAVVTSWNGATSTMTAYYRPAGGGWTGPETVFHNAYSGTPTSQLVEFDGQGRAVSAFSRQEFDHTLYAVVRSGGAWGAPEPLDATASVGVADLARHPSGLVAVWLRKQSLSTSNVELGAARLGAAWEDAKLYDPPGYFGSASVAATTAGTILLAAHQADADTIVGAILPSLTAPWPSVLSLLSPASTPTALYRDPVAAAGGSALVLAWGVHGAPTTYSQAIATNAANACYDGAAPNPKPPSTPDPTPTPTPPKTPKAIGGFVKLPSAKRCVKAGKLKVTLRSPAGFPVKRIVFRVRGKRVALRKGTGLTGSFTLKRLPKRRYRLEVVVTLADGSVLKGSLRYRPCPT
jgi:hypothetical protein